MAFPDNFNRPDGSLGSNWSVKLGSVSIASHQAVSAGTARVLCAAATEGGAQDHYIVIRKVGGEIPECRVYVKSDADCLNAYWGQISSYLGLVSVTTGWLYGGGNGGTSTHNPAMPEGDSVAFRVTYSGGVTTAYLNEDSIGTLSNADYGGQGYFGFGMGGAGIAIDAFDASGGDPLSMSVDPDFISNIPDVYALVATGTGTEWNAAISSDTTFTVDHGTVEGQFIVDETHVNVYYNPHGYAGFITFTESKYGLTATITTSPLGPRDTGDPTDISEGGAGILNRTGDDCAEGTLLSTCTPIDQEGTVNIPKGIDAILEQLGGYSGQVGPDIGAVSLPAQTLALFERPVVNPYWTAEDMVGALGGTPTIYSNADLYTALGNLPAATYQPVLDALVALQGESPPTLADLGTMISDIATISGYNLQDVRDWIDALPTPDLSPITEKLDLIQPSTAADMTTLTNDITGVDNRALALQDAFAALIGPEELTLQIILDAIQALAASQKPTAPVWPGADGVTLGTSVGFTENVSIDDDMDGVVIAVTTPPTHTGRYLIGDATLDYGVGRIAFVDDSGHIEPWQYLGFRSALFTPKCMVRAAGVKLQVLGGAEGTVTPWLINEPGS